MHPIEVIMQLLNFYFVPRAHRGARSEARQPEGGLALLGLVVGRYRSGLWGLSCVSIGKCQLM